MRSCHECCSSPVLSRSGLRLAVERRKGARAACCFVSGPGGMVFNVLTHVDVWVCYCWCMLDCFDWHWLFMLIVFLVAFSHSLSLKHWKPGYKLEPWLAGKIFYVNLSMASNLIAMASIFPFLYIIWDSSSMLSQVQYHELDIHASRGDESLLACEMRVFL